MLVIVWTSKQHNRNTMHYTGDGTSVHYTCLLKKLKALHKICLLVIILNLEMEKLPDSE
jgi:hypothetical protein